MDNLTFDPHELSPDVPSISYGSGARDALSHEMHLHPGVPEHHHSEPHLLSPGTLHRYQERLRQKQKTTGAPSRKSPRSSPRSSPRASPNASPSCLRRHPINSSGEDDSNKLRSSVRNGHYNGMSMSYPELSGSPHVGVGAGIEPGVSCITDGIDSTNTTNSPSLSPR